jgi:hypothetical protein
MTWYTGNTMVLRFLQTIPSLGGIYLTNTNSYQTIPITAPLWGPPGYRDGSYAYSGLEQGDDWLD